MRGSLKFLMTVGLVLAASSNAIAKSSKAVENDRSPITIKDSSCNVDRNDPYEHAVRFAPDAGKYRGQCINSEKFRIPVVLAETSKIAKVSNVLHDGRFWIASFPRKDDAIEAYEFLARRDGFLVRGGHTQLLIRFKKPVKLRAQNNLNDITYVRNFIYSVEATFPKDVKFSFMKGMKSSFVIMGRLYSAKQAISEEVEPKYERYPLKLGYQERAQLLNLVFEQIESFDNQTWYRTFKRNCASSLIEIFDKLPRFKDYQLGFKTSVSLDPLIGNSVKAVQKRGLSGKRLKSCGDGIKDCRLSIDRTELLD